jgi:hypothetical protein
VRSITVLSIPILLLIIAGNLSSRGVSSQTSQGDRLNRQLQELQSAPDQGNVDWYVRRAKLTGEKEVILPGFYNCGPDVPDLEGALRKWDVIVAESIERYVQIDQRLGLITWYKFRIIEDLSLERVKECSTCGDAVAEQPEIPAQLLPLASDEIVVPYSGGQLNIDGVKVVQPQALSVDFSTGLVLERRMPGKETEPSPYLSVANRQTFLMFLTIERGNRVGRLNLYDAGVFSFNSVGELRSFGVAGSLKLDLAKTHIKSLASLREYQKRLRERL